MKNFIFIFLLIPVFLFGQYRADRAITNPDLTGKDAAGYGLRGHMATAGETQVTPFTPDFDDNVWAWWNFTDTDSLTLSGPVNITMVGDLSGNNRPLTQADTSKSPHYSINGATGDAVNDLMTTPAGTVSQPFTIYIVLKQNTWTSARYILSEGAPPSTFAILQLTSTPNLNTYAGAWGAGNVDVPLGEKLVLTACLNGASSLMRTNNGVYTLYDGGATGFNGLSVFNHYTGGPNGVDVTLYEIIVREGADNDSIQSVIWQYLYAKHIGALTAVDGYVFSGQSNCRGQDSARLMTDQSYNVIYDSCYIWNYRPITDVWQKIHPGVNTLSFDSLFGAEVSLSRNLSRYKHNIQYVIKYGADGTYLAQGAMYDFNVASSNEGYDSLKIHVYNAANAMNRTGKILRIKHFVWMQGENDALNETYANAYRTNLNAFMSGILAHMTGINRRQGYIHTPDVAIGRISTSALWTYKTAIRTAQAGWCTDNGGSLINTDAYPRQTTPNDAHYTADGNIQFGIDIYNAIKDK